MSRKEKYFKGEKIGHLTIVERVGVRSVIVKCDCGFVKKVWTSYFTCKRINYGCRKCFRGVQPKKQRSFNIRKGEVQKDYKAIIKAEESKKDRFAVYGEGLGFYSLNSY